MTTKETIDTFLSAKAFGVAGASSRREKYGNKVLRSYLQNGYKAIPVHPVEKEVEGIPCVASVDQLPEEVESLSIITPPKVTEKIVDTVVAGKRIRNIWMQPGAQSPEAVRKCEEAGINVIADGTCLLVVLGFSEH